MLKVGKIEYLNTVPVYYGFLKGVVDSSGIEFVEDVPSELNRLLNEGFLDVSVVSSYEYIQNSKKYLLLPDLSISAERRVVSVLFLSTVPIHQLHRKDVWITRSSMTSKELLKYLLREVYGVEPNFYYYSMKENSLPKNPRAVLSIGDDALKLMRMKKFPFIYDLAEEWFNLTGFPFVFALWAVRKDSYTKKREEVQEFYRKLIKSRDYGKKHYSDICREYAPRLNLSEKMCKNYLNCLRFHLSELELKSLKLFSEKINKPFSPQFIET